MTFDEWCAAFVLQFGMPNGGVPWQEGEEAFLMAMKDACDIPDNPSYASQALAVLYMIHDYQEQLT